MYIKETRNKTREVDDISLSFGGVQDEKHYAVKFWYIASSLFIGFPD